MKIAFTGGGTIGHVAVNMALIPEAERKNIECFYIGSKKGIEKEMIESTFPAMKYFAISSGKLRRYFSVENAKDVIRVQKGIIDALKVLRKEKPDLIFSKGGFVSVPVILAAKMLGIPSIIHESDVTPGLANKLALKFTTRLYTTFKETLKFVPVEKTDYVGSIVREDLLHGSETEGFRLTGFNHDKKVLMVMGGSLGSKRLNKEIRDHLDELTQNYQIIHITGKGLKEDNYVHLDYQQFEFVKEELPHLYAITDTIISRAGANAIFEFLNLRKPMLLIPLGLDQSRGDQIENAKLFEKAGYAEVIQEEDLTFDRLNNKLQQIELKRSEMETAMSHVETAYTPKTLLEKMLMDINKGV